MGEARPWTRWRIMKRGKVVYRVLIWHHEYRMWVYTPPHFLGKGLPSYFLFKLFVVCRQDIETLRYRDCWNTVFNSQGTMWLYPQGLHAERIGMVEKSMDSEADFHFQDEANKRVHRIWGAYHSAMSTFTVQTWREKCNYRCERSASGSWNTSVEWGEAQRR